MKKISKVKVGLTDYKVREVDLEGQLGVTKCTEQKISIAPNLSATRLREVLTHEVLHAIINEYGVTSGMTHIDHNDEEGIVDRMALGLLDTISKNRILFKELFQL